LISGFQVNGIRRIKSPRNSYSRGFVMPGNLTRSPRQGRNGRRGTDEGMCKWEFVDIKYAADGIARRHITCETAFSLLSCQTCRQIRRAEEWDQIHWRQYNRGNFSMTESMMRTTILSVRPCITFHDLTERAKQSRERLRI
jgi:hypothetical protein